MLSKLIRNLSCLFGAPTVNKEELKRNNASAMRELRTTILTTPSGTLKLSPSAEAPFVHTVLMDWPMDEENMVTVYGSLTGDASLYTNSTFGVIGGFGHANVRSLAVQVVKAAQSFYDEAEPVVAYPYPIPDNTYFYLIGFQGVRRIQADTASLQNGTHRFAVLGNLFQKLITELRMATPK